VLKKLLLASVIVLAGLYVAADFGARALADAGVAKDLQTTLHLSSRPDVSLGGFPFIPKLVSGHFDTVTAAGHGLSSGDVRFSRVDLTVHDVKTSAWRLIRGAGTRIAIGSGAGTASMTAADASAALKAAGVDVTVTFENGHVLVHSPNGAGSVDVTPAIRHGALLLRSSNLPVSVRIPLPEIVPRLHYTDVRITGSQAELSFEIRSTTLDVPG
jgi:LmeA-like phospholipid-binding